MVIFGDVITRKQRIGRSFSSAASGVNTFTRSEKPGEAGGSIKEFIMDISYDDLEKLSLCETAEACWYANKRDKAENQRH